MAHPNDCSSNHSFFVAEVIGVPDEGKVFMLFVCTLCGDARSKEFKVANPGTPLRLLMEEKSKGQK